MVTIMHQSGHSHPSWDDQVDEILALRSEYWKNEKRKIIILIIVTE